MLRMVANSSSGAAKRYFTESLDRGDYYARGQELPGRWGGLGAKELSLEGEVRQSDFNALCENRKPGTEDPLTARTKDNRRVGYDINFHCPKSLSVVYALTGDQGLLDAFRQSVQETMQQIEEHAHCRVRKAGAQEDRHTGNLVWAEFIHQTARPVGGVPDPHLHAHCFTFNATWDKLEKQWKAGQFGTIKRDAPLFEACFHGRLAERVQQAGYRIQREGKFWELSGLPAGVAAAFSRRTEEIERLAAELSITDPDQKATLGARTRRPKQQHASLDELRATWEARLTPTDLAIIRGLKGPAHRLGNNASQAYAEKAVGLAIRHVFERQSIVREKDLIATAVRESYGKASVSQVLSAVERAPLIRHQTSGESHVTTKEVLHEETQMLKFARDGCGQCRPFLVGDSYQCRDDKLGQQQQRAVEHVLRSTDRVTIVRGGAGTGKTSLMREAVAAIENKGTRVITLAPSAEASRGVLRSEGFANAETVEKFLQNQELQKSAHGQLIWVDEAGLLGSRSMSRLFAAAKEQNSRLVLSGDWRQHRGVERGAALRLLEQEAGIRPAEITEIHRQRGRYRTAIDHMAAGRAARGFDELYKMGWIHEASPEDAHRSIAQDYVAAKRAGKSALVVCPTHGEGRQLTAALREELRQHKLLDRRGRELEQLSSLGWTQAEREAANRYDKGQVLRFHKSARGFRAGERTTVVGSDTLGNVWVQGKLGPCILPRHQADRFDVFKSESMDVAAGDLIRFTRNGRTADSKHAINNGAVYEVKGFTLRGEVKLSNGWVVPKDFGHFSHGYCVTSHSSQGKTVDRVFVALSKQSFGAASAEQFYVSTSRGRELCTIYTDDIQALRSEVMASNNSGSATVLAKEKDEHERVKDTTRQLDEVERRRAKRTPEMEL